MEDTKTPAQAIAEKWECPNNDGVSCSPYNRNCLACGWDPLVAKARLERICEELGIQVPIPQKTEAIED